jgi:hypothetical protein
MLATELLFVYVYCLVDDAIKGGILSIPRRPGPAPACTDAELLTVALVRHLLGRRSENGFLAEVRRDWGHLFPHLPDQPEVNRRTRWLWGAFEQLRAACAAAVPADPVQQIDTSALPVKHPSRVRGPDQWTGQAPQPGGDLVQGDHRPDGPRPPRRSHLRRAPDEDRRHTRGPHPPAHPTQRSNMNDNINSRNAPKLRRVTWVDLCGRRRMPCSRPAAPARRSHLIRCPGRCWSCCSGARWPPARRCRRSRARCSSG